MPIILKGGGRKRGGGGGGRFDLISDVSIIEEKETEILWVLEKTRLFSKTHSRSKTVAMKPADGWVDDVMD